MNNEFNIKVFVDEYLEKIINMKDQDLNYKDLQKIRQNIIDKYELDTSTIDSKQIVKFIKESDYVKLFKKIKLDEAANVIFLKKIDSSEIVEIFDNMRKGINERNILKKIYTQNKMFEDQYGVDLSDLEKFFKECKYHLKFEIMGNMATFLEKYYETPEGKSFIESYKDIKDDDGKMAYFRTVFEKMNQASIRKIFHTNNDGDVSYIAAGAGTLDGFFTIFDKNNNMNFNVSTTASPDVKIEGTSIIRHAITSKLIAEAIVEELNREIKINKDYDPFYGDNATDFKKMRAYYWNKMVTTSKGFDNQEKNNLIARALIAKINEHNLFEIDKSLLTETAKNTGKTTDGLVKVLNQQSPINTINMRLGTEGVITESKMRQFFNTNEEEGFQTNFLTEIKPIKNIKRYNSSGLKEIFEAAKINMYEFKTFLQNAALKNITLDEYNGGINKEAIDHFYDNVITRRVFASANQIKINFASFADRAESLFCKILVLADQENVNKYLRCLTGLDYGNVRDNLSYTLRTGDPETEQDINVSPISHIKERLDKLKVDVNPIVFLDRIRSQYKIELAKIFKNSTLNFEENQELKQKLKNNEADIEARIAKAVEEATKKATADLLRSQQEERDRNNKAVVKMEENLGINNTSAKKGNNGVIKLDSKDECDYSSQFKTLEKASEDIKSKSKNNNNTVSTSKKKIN